MMDYRIEQAPQGAAVGDGGDVEVLPLLGAILLIPAMGGVAGYFVGKRYEHPYLGAAGGALAAYIAESIYAANTKHI